jgi:hypothetical protein
MGWLKYVVAGVGGAIVGGPLGAAAAIGVVKGASVLMDTSEDDEAKKNQIASKHKKNVTEIVDIQEKREKLLAKDKERKQTVQKHTQKAQQEFKSAVINNAQQNREQNAQLVIALFAVGLAAAEADGHISLDEQRELQQFIHQISSRNYPGGKLPVAVVQKVEMFKSFKLSMEDAFSEIKRLEKPDFALFRRLIELIINADGGDPTSEETNLLKEYDKLVRKHRSQ